MKSDHTRFFLSLREAFFSSSSNINAIAANCLSENEWGCLFNGDKRGPRITCYAGRWLNTTDSVNTDQSDGMERERRRNGNVTYSVNRPIVVISIVGCIFLKVDRSKLSSPFSTSYFHYNINNFWNKTIVFCLYKMIHTWFMSHGHNCRIWYGR